MNSEKPAAGLIYRCPVCEAEIAVLSPLMGDFRPRCCGRPMVLIKRRLRFYRCPVCGAEIAVVKATSGDFRPRCCDTDMIKLAA